MVTMREVAAHARVSQKTVSRVFNDDPQVRPETRDRVRKAMRELGYVANPIAGVFRSGKVPAIGIAVPDLADPFFAAIVGAVDDAARAADMSTLVTSLGDDAGREADVVRTLLRRAPSGLIMAPVADDQSYLDLAAAGVPVVFVDREPAHFAGDTIRHDDATGARLAIEHLVAQGHRRIAFIGDSAKLPTTCERLTGYREALRDAGIGDDNRLEELGVLDETSALAAITTLEGLQEPPTAVFSSNARSSMLLVSSVARAGLAFVSFGDFPMAAALTPPVCAIDQSPRSLGELAAQRILERIRQPETSREQLTTVLPVTLRERGSCQKR